MNILIIGGTGATGRELIKQALEQGYKVTALVRNPNKLKVTNRDLKILKGNVLDSASIHAAMAGQDAVLSALGHKRFFVYTDILSKGTSNIIQAMNDHKVKRFICITTLGINDSRFKLGLYYTLFVIPLILFFYFIDKAKQEKIIMNSNLDWTIVRPVQLTNGKKTGRYKHGDKIGHYILTKMISRANVVDFMLKQLTANSYIKKSVGLSN